MSPRHAYQTEAVYVTPKFENRLQAIPGFALTVLEAPVGYGKTTAVRFFENSASLCILNPALKNLYKLYTYSPARPGQ